MNYKLTYLGKRNFKSSKGREIFLIDCFVDGKSISIFVKKDFYDSIDLSSCSPVDLTFGLYFYKDRFGVEPIAWAQV